MRNSPLSERRASRQHSGAQSQAAAQAAISRKTYHHPSGTTQPVSNYPNGSFTRTPKRPVRSSSYNSTSPLWL